MTLAEALHRGQFEWIVTTRTLRRDTHPLAFWGVAALIGAMAAGALWFLIVEVRTLNAP
jgi:hypothetical protein